MGGGAHACNMLRLGRPVGVYPRLEARLAEIRIGGRDYKKLTQSAIQSRIGMVLQTPHLFSGTIEDNIRYGRLDASDEDVREAARVALHQEPVEVAEFVAFRL